MKRFLLLLSILIPVMASGQVVNYAKTLPVRSFSLGVAPAYFLDNASVGLRTIGVEADQGGAFAVGVSGGYGLQYSLDLNAKFVYVMGGEPFFGADLQYLIHESRNSYFSVIGGLHYWDNFGVDLTGLFTYSLSYDINVSAGLDLDVNYDPAMSNNVRTRVWLPLNIGFNISDYTFLYAEFDLQVSQWAWGIVAVGANFIFR
ncbi:MAG: hypothetical protein GY790_23285 [Bacteroidetes bacterium]|nr:hypothetical protein [Bacteroidota bacterium]